MRQEQIIPSLQSRLGHRANLGILVLVGGLFCLFAAALGPQRLSAASLTVPFVLLFSHLALSPLPWQWTGDEAPMAGLGRGFLQAVAFNLAWVLLAITLLHAAGGLGPSHPGPHGPAHRVEAGPAWEGPPHGELPARPDHDWMPGLGFALLNVAFATVFGWLLAGKEATEARERATASLLRQSRARALQGQLEPHVLYNALNGLSELVHEDPLAAEEMIARLADLYRMLTHHGESDRVPLAQERRLVEAYLSMEEMRLGERLRTQWDWPAWADDVVLPPLFLQPLVENAIKHGLSPCQEGGDLRIAMIREGDRLALTVANTGLPLASVPREGVGLGNLRARLALWTDSPVAFSLEQQGAWTVATISWNGRS